MKVPRFRVYNPEEKTHYTILCLDFEKDTFFARLGGDYMAGKISESEIEMQSPIVDNRGLDIYEGDIVRKGRDRIRIIYDQTHGAFVGKNLNRTTQHGRLNDSAMLHLSGQCELLGPEILGH